MFLFCLVIPFRRIRPLIIIVTSFTLAHSISLIASVCGFVPDALWFPPLIETLIAVTIVYMALENIVYAALGKNVRGEISRRWSSPSFLGSSTASAFRSHCAYCYNLLATILLRRFLLSTSELKSHRS